MSNSLWYVINVRSGFEGKVAQAIREKAAAEGFSDSFEEIIVPTESVSEVKKGKKVVSDKKIFPGYILIKMKLDDFTWNIVKNTPKVAGLLGANKKPVPVPESEIAVVLNQVAEGSVVKEPHITFDIGEVLKIIDGPFESFTGSIEGVDYEKRMLMLSVVIFGRHTSVELGFHQVEKIK